MRSLPPNMADKWGHLNELTYHSGTQHWTSWCPNCHSDGHDPASGPTDRFQIYEAGPNARTTHGWCRQCGHLEFVDDNGKPWSRQKAEEAKRLRREEAEKERKRLKAKQTWLQQQTFWLEWHDNMMPRHRDMWHDQGIGDWAIETHKLGYTDDRYSTCGGALTIPYMHGQDIATLQLRLLQPPNENDKYRFEKDLKAEWFRPWPEDEITGTVLILEGAKKAMVVWQEAGQIMYKDEPITIIATPSKYVASRLIPELEKAKRLIWLLDPDAYKATKSNGVWSKAAVTRNIEMAGKDKSLVIRTVGAKIDDMFLKYHLKEAAFQNMVNQAGPWRV